jgi:hypothetical protein
MTSGDVTNANKAFFFDGSNVKLYDQWATKTLAVAKSKKFALALTTDRVLPTASELANNPTEVQTAIAAQNDAAYIHLILHCNDTAMQYVENDAENARLAWITLARRYAPTEMNAYLGLTEQFIKCVISNFESPELWIMALGKLNQKIEKVDKKFRKDEQTMIVHIIAGLPDEHYHSLKTTLTIQGLDKLTVEGITKNIQDFYLVNGLKEVGEIENMALAITIDPEKCTYCYKLGHTEDVCRKKIRQVKGGHKKRLTKEGTKDLSLVVNYARNYA